MSDSNNIKSKIQPEIAGLSGNKPPVMPTNRVWFFFMYLYIIIDYARPQDTFSFLTHLRPAMLTIIVLSIFILSHLHRIDFKIHQIRLISLLIALLAAYIPFARNNFFAYNTTKTMLLLMPFILSCIVYVNSIRNLRLLIIILICLMTYQAQYSILHGGKGTGNQFLDENDLSLYINTWLPFSIALFFTVKGVFKKILLSISTGLGLGAVVISLSRGGFLGLIGMFAVYWLLSPKKIVSLLIVGMIALCLYIFAGDAYWNEMGSATNADSGTGLERIESWKSAINMFKAHPFGVGGGNFPAWFATYQTSYFSKGMWGRQAHSLWFTLLPELGIQGVIIYILLIIVNIKNIFYLKKNALLIDKEDGVFIGNLAVAFFASLGGYFCSGTFVSVLYYAHYWYLTGIIAASALIVKRIIDKKNESVTSSEEQYNVA